MKRIILVITALLAIISLILYYPLSPQILPPTTQKMPPFPTTKNRLAVTDAQSGSHYFYHSHREGEHGHFHTFFTFKHHIVGISLDENKQPSRIFVTAPWVTGEKPLKTEELMDQFSFEDETPENRWLMNFFTAYRTEIETLLQVRDHTPKPPIGRYEVIAEITVLNSPHGPSAGTCQME